MPRVTIITGSLLVILLLILTLQTTSPWTAELTVPFSDIDSQNLAGHATLYLAHRGLIEGFSDGTFRGFSGVNRAEAAKLLILAAGHPIDERIDNPFWDVSPGAWFTPFVLAAEQRGIVDGYPDGSFRPARGITTAEFIKMAATAFKLPLALPHRFTDFPARSWFTPFAGAAWHYHFFPNRVSKSLLLPDELLTRNDMAIALFQIATFGTKAHFIDRTWNTKQDRNDLLRSHGQALFGGTPLSPPDLTGALLPGYGKSVAPPSSTPVIHTSSSPLSPTNPSVIPQ